MSIQVIHAKTQETTHHKGWNHWRFSRSVLRYQPLVKEEQTSCRVTGRFKVFHNVNDQLETYWATFAGAWGDGSRNTRQGNKIFALRMHGGSAVYNE